MIFGLMIVLSYLIGSIPSGLIVGKWFYGTDIRHHGSGNLGATNTFRTLGIKAGIIVTIADILKGTIATLLPFMFGSDFHPLIVGIFSVIGHMFPIFAGFRGGKAVATSAGIILAYEPFLFIILFIAFLITLKICKYVSLSSIIGAVLGLIYTIVVQNWALALLMTAITIFVVYRHRANIKRIREKTEPKVTWI